MSNFNCKICGQPMPPGEEMFRYHGYSGPCPTAEKCKHCGEPIDENCDTKALTYKCGSAVHTDYQSDRCRIAELEKQFTALLRFLKRCSEGYRIVSSGDLSEWQIAEAQARKLFYIEPGGGLGWALLPWSLTTANDEQRTRGKIENQASIAQLEQQQLATAKDGLQRMSIGDADWDRCDYQTIAAETLRQLNEKGGGE